MSVQVRYCCQLSSDQVFLLDELPKTGGFQKFLDLGIVAKGLGTVFTFLVLMFGYFCYLQKMKPASLFFPPTGYEIKSVFYRPVNRN